MIVLRLFLLTDPEMSVSHMLVLPRHPSAMAEMTPTTTDPGFSFDDFIKADPDGEGADPLLDAIGDDLFKVNYITAIVATTCTRSTCTRSTCTRSTCTRSTCTRSTCVYIFFMLLLDTIVDCLL